MPTIDKHPTGNFCWVELSTTDQAAAKSFYTALFGWSFNEFPIGPQDMYTIFSMQGRDAAAAYTIRKEELAHGVPPHWNLYVAVDNADKSATKAAELGGKVLQPAFDVMDAGRMAVVQDPTGATFMVWQAKNSQGIGITNEDGAFCWADLNTHDPEKAAKFYRGLFGWETMKGEKDDYLHIKNGEPFIGGIPPAKHHNPKMPPHWLIYFQVADVKGAAAKATSLGAKVWLQPMQIEKVGTMAVLADPQGAAFAIFTSART